MIDRGVLLLVGGCVLFAAIIVAELSGSGDDAPATKPPSRAEDAPAAGPGPAAPLDTLLATTLARPLFDATRRPSRSGGESVSAITDKRLAGIVIEPGQRLAIFAVDGAKPLALSEGETVDGWRIESITPREVSLRGPNGTETFQPKLDPKRVFPTPAQPPVNPTAPGAAQPAVPPVAAAPRRGALPGPAAVPRPGSTRRGHDQ